MNVLSLFDGISCAQIALNKLNVKYENYFASEIDSYAISITQKNYPNTIQLGDVSKIETSLLPFIDLLVGGSPCQDLSIAKGKTREGLSGNRSGLFFQYVRILHELRKINPDIKFVLENVESMTDENRDVITKEMGVEPIMIDATLVSAQQRKRYFWTNIEGIEQPEDLGLTVRHIIDVSKQRKYLSPVNVVKSKRGVKWDTSGKGYFSQQDRAYSILGKFPTIPTARTITKLNVLFEDGSIGVLNWHEAERLQCIPDNYTDLGLVNRVEKRGAVIGNCFNVDVMAHILKSLK
jgi:site-specific DNA-cytosine methylase